MSHPAICASQSQCCSRHVVGLRRVPESRAVIALLCSMFLIFSGCTTTQTVDPWSPAALEGALKRGDEVVVFLEDGSNLELSVVEWTGEELVGEDGDGQSHTVSSQDIEYLDVTRSDPAKTTTLVIVALLCVVLGAYVAASAVDPFLVPPLL